MFVYLLKILLSIVLLFSVITLSLKIMMPTQSEKTIVETSVLMTGLLSILYVLISGSVERMEGFEETPNAEQVAQNEELEKTVESDVQNLLNKVTEQTDTKEDVIEDGPKPSTNSSIITTEGTSEQPTVAKTDEVIADSAPKVEHTAEPIPEVDATREPRPEPQIEAKQIVAVDTRSDITKEIEKKYTILPVEQWMRPAARDIISATPCMCPSVSSYNDMYAEY